MAVTANPHAIHRYMAASTDNKPIKTDVVDGVTNPFDVQAGSTLHEYDTGIQWITPDALNWYPKDLLSALVTEDGDSLIDDGADAIRVIPMNSRGTVDARSSASLLAEILELVKRALIASERILGEEVKHSS